MYCSANLSKFCRATLRSLMTFAVLLMLVLSSGPEGRAAGLLSAHDPLASHSSGKPVSDSVHSSGAESVAEPIELKTSNDSSKSVTACDAMCFGYVLPAISRGYVIAVSVLLLLPLIQLDVPGQAGTSIEKPPKLS